MAAQEFLDAAGVSQLWQAVKEKIAESGGGDVSKIQFISTAPSVTDFEPDTLYVYNPPDVTNTPPIIYFLSKEGTQDVASAIPSTQYLFNNFVRKSQLTSIPTATLESILT